MNQHQQILQVLHANIDVNNANDELTWAKLQAMFKHNLALYKYTRQTLSHVYGNNNALIGAFTGYLSKHYGYHKGFKNDLIHVLNLANELFADLSTRPVTHATSVIQKFDKLLIKTKRSLQYTQIMSPAEATNAHQALTLVDDLHARLMLDDVHQQIKLNNHLIIVQTTGNSSWAFDNELANWQHVETPTLGNCEAYLQAIWK